MGMNNIIVSSLSFLSRLLQQHTCDQVLSHVIECTHYLAVALALHNTYKAALRSTCHDERGSTEDLLIQTKLHLVLDIDHTLLHAASLASLTPHVMDTIESDNSSTLFKLDSNVLVVKLRPFVRTFLDEASAMFEMSLYTRGVRSYAKNVAKLLDPQGLYFADRIVSREDTPTKRKTLDLLDVGKRAIVIINDKESIWQRRDKGNLIVIEQYRYFVKDVKGIVVGFKSNTGSEEEEDDRLRRMFVILKELHQSFFNQLDYADVRVLIESMRASISDMHNN